MCVCVCVYREREREREREGFPGGSDGKESAYNAGDLGLTPGSGRSSGEGNGNPFPYSLLENSMNRGAWWAPVHGIAESDMTEQLTLHFKQFCKDPLTSQMQTIVFRNVDEKAK